MRILFLCDSEPNYVPDLLLHGLRRRLGPDLVDYPRKAALYEGRLGQPYLSPIPALMGEEGEVDRTDIAGRIRRGQFDFVLADARALPARMALLNLAPIRLAVIDGEDIPAAIAPGPYVILRRETDGRDAAAALPMSLPEPVLAMIARHDDTPKTRTIGFLGSRSARTPSRNALLDALERRFPDGLIGAWQTEGTQTEEGQSDRGGWAEREAYYRALQSCQIVLSLPGMGLDTFRYWENAACNALHLAQRTALFIPDDFREGSDILRFDGIDGLVGAVQAVLDGQHDWRGFAAHSRAWLLAHHTTERRAAQVIDVLRRAFGMVAPAPLAQPA